MTTVGRFIPIYDAWSNEGGGRAIEEGIRYSERKDLERFREEMAEMERSYDNTISKQKAGLKSLQESFVARYGADALANKDSLLRRGPDDTVTLSRDGAAMLAELTTLEKSRVRIEQTVNSRENARRSYRTELEGRQAFYEARQNSYDSRFERDDNLRADAYERAQAARSRLEALAAQSAEWNAQSIKRAGELAAARQNSEALVTSAKLFQTGGNGDVKIDGQALVNLGPSQAATAELARLIGTLAERNGLGQLRDALIGAINGQNRRIGELTGATT